MATKEQVKTRVTFLNSIASGSVVASVITPAVGLSIGVIQWPSDRLAYILSACLFWFVVGVMFHLVATRLAGGLE